MCDIIVVINCGNIKLDIELQFYLIKFNRGSLRNETQEFPTKT